jgi:hypothetical protein
MLQRKNYRNLSKLPTAALNIRYQLTENIRCIDRSIPIIWTHTVIFIVYFIGLIALPHVSEINDLIGTIIYQESVSVLFIYPLAHLIVIYADRRIVQNRRNRTVEINANAIGQRQQKRHFDQLRKSWM